MKLLRRLICASPVVLLFLLFADPAFAQFEINPDHFDNPQPTTSKKPVQKTKTQNTTAAKQSANGKSLTAADPAAMNSTSKTSQASGQAKTPPTGAKGSSATAAKQSQGKTKTSPPAQSQSEDALFVPRE